MAKESFNRMGEKLNNVGPEVVIVKKRHYWDMN